MRGALVRPVCARLAAALAMAAAYRGSDSRKLVGLLRGELDWIAMKALDKDRSRRYETANGLVQDIQHYLADEPVQACPPSAWYRLSKLVRRNKGKFGGGLAMTLFLIAAIVGLLGLAALGLIRRNRK